MQRVWIEGYEARPDEDLSFLSNTVGPDYFTTLKIRLIAGREFEARDDGTAEAVAMVNETMARRFWGEPARAIGQRLRQASGGWRTVVGVAAESSTRGSTKRPGRMSTCRFCSRIAPS